MRRSTPLLAALVASLAGCGGDGGDHGGDDPTSAVIVTTTASPPTRPSDPATTGPVTTVAPSTTSPTTPPATSPTASPTIEPSPAVGDPIVTSEHVTTVVSPVDLAVRPGDDALYLVGQNGEVTRHDPDAGESTTVLRLDAGRLSRGNEQGLLGLAFSPDGSLAYIDFTDRSGTTVIAEFAVGATGVFDTASEREVLQVAQPYGNHNAGDLEFGPDGMLFITLGDGGSGGDPERRAGDPTRLLGSILRIDPHPTGERPYTIPPENPFADGIDGAPEVWATGLRNPWKIAFDPVTGDLWIADVGQNRYEEVNRVAPTADLPAGWGVNFGWSALEGTQPFNADVPAEGTTLPVLTYEHGDDGCSVSGGVPYRGSAIPELEPAYLYSDFCGGTLWALDLEGGRVLTLLTGFEQVTGVRAGPDGEVYVLERSGGVHRLVPG